FLDEIPEEVREEVRLGRKRPPQTSWQQRPYTPSPRPAQPPQQRIASTANNLSSFFGGPVQLDSAAIRAATPSAPQSAQLKRGQRVRHSQFGDGTILTMEGDGPDAKLTVYFDRAGSKKFIAKYAKLTRI